MLIDLEPNSLVTGGPIGGTDPQGIEIINSLMDRVFDFVVAQGPVTYKEIIIFMKQIGSNLQGTGMSDEHSIRNFKDDDYTRIIEAMLFDQRLEQTQDGHFQAVNFNYPASLISFPAEDGATSQTNSRILFTEIPCCHCTLAS